MRKIIKDIKSLAALLMVGVAFTACSTSSDDNIEQPANGKYTLTVKASKAASATTRALSYNDATKTLNATWTKGDRVEVYTLDWEKVEQSGGTKFPTNLYLGTLTAQSDGASTTLDGTITAPPAVPEAYQGIFSVPVSPLILFFPRFPQVYTGQKGTLDDIAANFDYAVRAIVNWTVTDGKISTAGDVTFINENQSIVRFTLQDKAGNDINVKSLTLHDANGHDFKIYDDGESQDYGDLTISLDNASSEVWVSIPDDDISNSHDLEMTATTEEGDTYTYSKSNVQITSGQFYSITVKMTK